LLEHKADFPVAHHGQLVINQGRYQLIIQVIIPEVGTSRQPIMFIKVDLPDPEGPMMASTSPGFNRETDPAQGMHLDLTHLVDLGQVFNANDIFLLSHD
jgi:hypothetical protein